MEFSVEERLSRHKEKAHPNKRKFVHPSEYWRDPGAGQLVLHLIRNVNQKTLQLKMLLRTTELKRFEPRVNGSSFKVR